MAKQVEAQVERAGRTPKRTEIWYVWYWEAGEWRPETWFKTQREALRHCDHPAFDTPTRIVRFVLE